MAISSCLISSTIYEKFELLHDRKCVRIFCIYQRHYILMLKPRGFYRPLGFLLPVHIKLVVNIVQHSIDFPLCRFRGVYIFGVAFRINRNCKAASYKHHRNLECIVQCLPKLSEHILSTQELKIAMLSALINWKGIVTSVSKSYYGTSYTAKSILENTFDWSILCNGDSWYVNYRSWDNTSSTVSA